MGNTKPPEWTGELIGEAHNAGITMKDVAKEAGFHEKYVSRLLNGHQQPPGAEEKLRAALERLKAEREDTT